MDGALPVNVYHEVHKVMVAAPLPGMEPRNIRVEVAGRRLSIHGALRGPGQRRKQYVLRQWTAGPYHCTVDLPASVDATRANATFDNGVLVVILPLAAQPISGTISMLKIGTTKGQLIRHVGLIPVAR
ncbi:MAG: Hsp20/alpha crystallin family protein [bacterium]